MMPRYPIGVFTESGRRGETVHVQIAAGNFVFKTNGGPALTPGDLVSVIDDGTVERYDGPVGDALFAVDADSGGTRIPDEEHDRDIIALECRHCGAPLPRPRDGWSECKHCATVHRVRL